MTVPIKSSLPPWLKIKFPSGPAYDRLRGLVSSLNLHTVCVEARCPNIAECWGGGTATFMIMGDACTRGCRFCSVHSLKTPGPLNEEEPQTLARAVETLALDYVVITSVARDDLPDQGAHHFAKCIRAIKERTPKILIEALIPDFQGSSEALGTVLESQPEVLDHNVETVERLTPLARDRRSSYRLSLRVLGQAKSLNPKIYTKSSLMLGLGETEEEVIKTFEDLRFVGVDFLTIGQYLRPTRQGRHLAVAAYVPPEKFDAYKKIAQDLGFLYAASGPFVRSSYKAGEFFVKSVLQKEKCLA